MTRYWTKTVREINIKGVTTDGHEYTLGYECNAAGEVLTFLCQYRDRDSNSRTVRARKKLTKYADNSAKKTLFLNDWHRDEGFGDEIFDGECTFSMLLPYEVANGVPIPGAVDSL